MTHLGSYVARPAPRMVRAFGSVLIALSASLVAVSSALAATGSIAGVVTDASSSAAIAGATVKVGSQSAVTDATGHYKFASVSTGPVTVSASATFYAAASKSASVARKTTTTVNFALSPNFGSLSGSVTDAATGAGLAGATVTVTGTASSTTTDSTGHYSFARVTAGTQTDSVTVTGYQSASQSVAIPVGGSAVANAALKKATISGPGSTIFWNGSNSYLLGVNYPWYNYGTDFGTGGWGKFTDWGAVSTNFGMMGPQGVRVIRWWLFGDGRYAPEFNTDGTVSGLDSYVLSDIDQALQAAAKNNVYILFTVIDNNIWSGASFSGSVQMGGHAALVTNATVQQSFLDNALKPVLQHVAASPNANRVLGYDIVNEPEGNMSGYWGGVNLQPSQVQTFVQRCASYIHTYGGGAYATVGSATPYYVSAWKGLGLDFYQIHYYPWMDFSNGAGSGLPTYASLGLDKPCIVGEFPTVDASYGLNDTNIQSARWYLDAIYKNGYAGALAWSYNAGDSATNWTAFAPVLTSWYQTYQTYVGPK